MAPNLMFLLAIIQRNILHLPLWFWIKYTAKVINDLTSGSLFFFYPLLINYLLIFKTIKFLALIEKYKSENEIILFGIFLLLFYH
jgi:hypothetical protein